MSKKILVAAAMLFTLIVVVPSVHAQGGVRSGPDPSLIRDPDLEKDSLHNLEVARNYFRLKKAYVAALMRCEEIIAGNPNFAKIEEVLYMAGRSSLSLAESKGKQKPDLYMSFDGGVKKTLTPDQFRQMGRDYLTRLIDQYPDSPYAKQAQEDLDMLGAPKPKQ